MLLSPCPPLPRQLKKRALDQLRLVKPKHVGGSAGDCPEQLLMEPCSGEHTAAEARPVLVSGRVHVWVSFGPGGPFCLQEPVEGLPVGSRAGCPGPETWAPPGGRRATGVEGASRGEAPVCEGDRGGVGSRGSRGPGSVLVWRSSCSGVSHVCVPAGASKIPERVSERQ